MNITSFLALISMAGALQAAVTLDPIFGDHMVLQQGKAIPITGTTTKGGDITVSFGDQTVSAKVKSKKWRAVLQPMDVSAEGRTLTVTQGKESTSIDDVLVGEVWLASGQSNMLRRMDEMQTGKADIAASTNPLFRFYHSEPQVHTNAKAYTDTEKEILNSNEMYQGSWAVCGPNTVRRMSAVGYYFAQQLQKDLGVPVGVIHASLGGSEMMAWIPNSLLKKKYRSCMTSKWLDSDYMSAWVRKRARQNIGNDLNMPHPYKPGYLFETGIRPWCHFPIAGVIWYQGESDAEIQDQKQNFQLLTDLITSWRAEFKTPNLPFLQVQLPRINDKTPLRAYWPEFRQVQDRAAQALPGVGYVTTIDLGSTTAEVHPPRKTEVGQRLAILAEAKVYGKEKEYSGPTISQCEPKGNKILVSFYHADGLKTTDGQPPRGFEVAGSDGRFSEATAKLDGNKVELSSDTVKKPQSVRYGWYTFMEPNLVNRVGLPAVPYAPSGKFKKDR